MFDSPNNALDSSNTTQFIHDKIETADNDNDRGKGPLDKEKCFEREMHWTTSIKFIRTQSKYKYNGEVLYFLYFSKN